MDELGDASLGPHSARWLVAFASGAVLMLEIVSLRLVAPYVGLTLETSTAVIGFALGAIAAGATLGGQFADRFSPTRLLGPVLLAAGVLVVLVGPLVRWAGSAVPAGDIVTVLTVTAIAVFPPAALLSTVTPMVAKIRLRALAETGAVVGSLSGVATLGALVATFVTGFVLVAAVPTTVILNVLGGSLSAVGLTFMLRYGMRPSAGSVAAVVVVAAGAAAAPTAPCEIETAYYCAVIVRDPERASGRTLQLDTLSHSYVDLNDPTYLEFTYMRGVASVVDELLPQNELSALHIGGGGLTLPRYLAATRTGVESLVFEIDREVVELNERYLEADLGGSLDVRVQDARVGLASEPSDSRDLVVGDAFSGLSVPWHLTTTEAVGQIQRVLKPRGIYVVNLIDYPPLGFVRSEVATMADIFPNVAVIARPRVLEQRDGGNVLVVASEVPLPERELRAALSQRAPELDILGEEGLEDFIGEAQVLTDDFAPVDQLLNAYPVP